TGVTSQTIGNFVLNYGTQLTQLVAYDPNPAILQANLQAALNTMFGAGNATAIVSFANNLPTQADITFGNTLARTNLQPLTLSFQNEVQSLPLSGGTGGTF